ncbi:N-acetyltransferase [Zobellella endophytica]|uniref:N-acetyltransferase n=2 Tax=Zobellella endophytica TaxID=2116700 RepID=A0A2P7RDE3_9GAMM|nr:N-acetyltransferase [Zobellella endophytica]
MTRADLDGAARVHQMAFPRQRRSRLWLECNLNGFPRMLPYVAVADFCLGYVLWVQKSGFRPEAVLELDQLAVLPEARSRGIGRRLLEESLAGVRLVLAEQQSVLKSVLVSTRADNDAQRLYQAALGARVEAVISGLYSADEVLMVARTP